MDAGDTTGLRDLTVMLDIPEVVSVARMVWSNGIGYEVLISSECTVTDYLSVAAIVGQYRKIQMEAWYPTESGYDQYRELFWEC